MRALPIPLAQRGEAGGRVDEGLYVSSEGLIDYWGEMSDERMSS